MQKSDNHSHIIFGTCMWMCPEKERQLRETEGLLHRFEYDEESLIKVGQEVDQMTRTLRAMELDKQSRSTGCSYNQVPAQSNVRNDKRNSRGKTLPKADASKTIKSFARSAAGLDKAIPEDLRPRRVLEKTVAYLYKEIFPRTDTPYITIYDFIFDRLRSVRQDLVIQRICDKTAILILESIVRFHVYSAYRLRNEPVSVFDSHINQRHLTDCLKTLLGLYESNEYCENSRMEFETLYILLAPSSFNAFYRALSLDCQSKTDELICAVKMSLAYQFKNYVKYFRLSKRLSPLLASCIAQHTREIRGKAFQSMSAAYGSKGCKVPLTFLTSVLDYPDTNSLTNDLNRCRIEVFSDEESGPLFARFDKSNSTIAKSQMESLSCEFGGKNSGCNTMSPSVCLYLQ